MSLNNFWNPFQWRARNQGVNELPPDDLAHSVATWVPRVQTPRPQIPVLSLGKEMLHPWASPRVAVRGRGKRGHLRQLAPDRL